jgi:hypothetical protein
MPSFKHEIPAWLNKWKYDRYVTLATNDPSMAGKSTRGSSIPHRKVRNRLREWDGRVNHAILGKHWALRHSDRMWSFFFLEKANSNPHWHGIVRFFPVENMEIADQAKIFDENAERIWKYLVPPGSVDIQLITAQRGLTDYISKMTPDEVSYENFVTPDEFMRG